MRAVRIGGGLLAAAVLCVLLAPGRAQAQPPKKVDAATKKLMGANGLLLAEVFKLAAEEYAEFLAKYPNHKQATSARYGLAICRYRLEQYAQAAKDVAAVLKDTQFKKRDEALAVLGYCHLAEKEHDKALAVFEQLLAKHPTSGHAEFAAVSRLQALYLLDQAKPAGDACAAFTKKYPKSGHLATVAYYLALSQSSLSAHADAEATLTAFLKNYPTSPYALDAMLLLGQSLESQGKLDPAAEQYRKLSKTAPPDRQAEGYYSLGLVLYKQGKFPGSIKELAVVVTKHPRSAYVAPARFQLGVASPRTRRARSTRSTGLRGATSPRRSTPRPARRWTGWPRQSPPRPTPRAWPTTGRSARPRWTSTSRRRASSPRSASSTPRARCLPTRRTATPSA